MIYPIVKFPDPILQRPSAPVTEFNDELRKLVADMFESMYAAQGIGLAAPQIGIAKRLTVIDLSNQKEPKDKIVLINPEITLQEGKQLEEEGCLSLPEIREKVRLRLPAVTARRLSMSTWYTASRAAMLLPGLRMEKVCCRERSAFVSVERSSVL